MPVTTSELDELVATLKFPVDPDTQQVRSFRTFQETKEFLEREVEFWKPHMSRLSNIYNTFQFVLNALNQAAMQPDI